MITAGIDIGSLWTKGVVLQDNRICAYEIQPTGMQSGAAAEKVFEHALVKAQLSRSDIGKIIATGYGRAIVPWATRTITEITCTARGIHWFRPSARTVIDIGGQDVKAIRLDADGSVMDFAMNDKCAAGTGRFIEVMAQAAGVTLEEIGDFSLRATSKVEISSVCTVFAESEVISLVSQGVPVPDVIAGVFDAISERVLGLAGRIGLEKDYAMSGGVAKNSGVVRMLEARIGDKLLIPEEPRIVGALGAALIAAEL